MNFILFETETDRANLLPFTYTRPVAAIRCGILTIAEKWQHALGETVSFKTEAYLQAKFHLKQEDANVMINGAVMPSPELAREIKKLKSGQALYKGEVLVASYVPGTDELAGTERLESSVTKLNKISNTYDIFSGNGEAIEADFLVLTQGRKSQPVSSTNQVVNPERIFIEEGARVEFSILNASSGSIYIGKDAEIMEGCKVRGPFALGEHAGLKMDAKIYGPTTVGPHCKVGGEVNNVVFFSYSNVVLLN